MGPGRFVLWGKLMEAYQAFYDFVLGLVGLITNTGGLWRIVGPFVLLFIVLRIVRWASSTARGERDYDELRQEGEENADRLRATSMAAQREWNLRHYPHQRAGFRRAREDYYQGMRQSRRRP